MMTIFPLSPRLRQAGAAVLFLTTLAAGRALPERNFEASRSLATEVSTMVELLEDYHFNRRKVDQLPKPAIGENLINDYMAELDGQRLFFLAPDLEAFTRRYANALYYNLQRLGDLKAAFDIYVQYEKRVEARINWIKEELKQDFDFTTHETYPIARDRSKAPWPATQAEADDLWRRRLKFELLQDLLNDKPAAEAKKNVQRRYERMLKNLADIETDEIAEMFLSSLAQLYDPHSSYMSPRTYEDFGIHMRLSLEGIGAILGVEEDECVIKELIPGGPADLSRQINPNDKIVAVTPEGGEHIDIIGMKLPKIVDLIRGQKGTKVGLTIVPAGVTDGSVRKEVTIVRDAVKLNAARARAAIYRVPDESGGVIPIGVITLPSFYGLSEDETISPEERTSATEDVAELINRLDDAGIKGLVLDLRRNGGGLLSEAVKMTGLFIDHGPVVQVKNFSGDVKIDGDDDPRITYSGPLAVLVSRLSASASEIVAGSLQNYGRAVIIGDRSTHGKGSVQLVLEMKSVKGALARASKTGAAKLTVQKFYLPNGSSTQNKGVTPDIVLPSVDEFLPIGESDLPYALAWDEIRPTRFSGHPLDPRLAASLSESSRARQDQLEEFAYLSKNIAWFKSKQEQTDIPLDLDDRRRIKESDDAFKKEMDAEKERLALNDFNYDEFTLAPDPPKPRAAEKNEEEEDSETADPDEDPGISKVDIPLRESLRVLVDVLDLSKNPQYWVDGNAPLTAQAPKKS